MFVSEGKNVRITEKQGCMSGIFVKQKYTKELNGLTSKIGVQEGRLK